MTPQNLIDYFKAAGYDHFLMEYTPEGHKVSCIAVAIHDNKPLTHVVAMVMTCAMSFVSSTSEAYDTCFELQKLFVHSKHMFTGRTTILYFPGYTFEIKIAQ